VPPDSPSATELVEAGVVDDAVEPGLRCRAAAKTRQGAVGLDIGVLERVVHAVGVGEQAEGE